MHGWHEALVGNHREPSTHRNSRRLSKGPMADIVKDICNRLPWYSNDWAEGISYGHKIFAPSLYSFFASVLPALAFGEQLARETDGQLTVVHVLASTAIAGVTQALFGGQPLLIIGVAEPIVIIYSFLYSFASDRAELGSELFLPWAAWVCVWTALMVALVAVSGACRGIERFTRMAGELFGLLIAVLFLQQAVKGLISEFREDSLEQSGPPPPPWLLVNGLWAIILAVGLLASNLAVVQARSWTLGTATIRGLFADYGVPGLVVAFSGLSFALASQGNPVRLPSDVPRRITTPLTWEVHRWGVVAQMADVPGAYIAAALLPAFFITILFWFDHGVSSQMAQPKELNLRKPPAYAWDMLLLSLLTLMMGLLGLPPVNGVLPQAPMHTRALAALWSQHHKVKVVGTDADKQSCQSADGTAVLEDKQSVAANGHEKGAVQMAVQQQVPQAVVAVHIGGAVQDDRAVRLSSRRDTIQTDAGAAVTQQGLVLTQHGLVSGGNIDDVSPAFTAAARQHLPTVGMTATTPTHQEQRRAPAAVPAAHSAVSQQGHGLQHHHQLCSPSHSHTAGFDPNAGPGTWFQTYPTPNNLPRESAEGSIRQQSGSGEVTPGHFFQTYENTPMMRSSSDASAVHRRHSMQHHHHQHQRQHQIHHQNQQQQHHQELAAVGDVQLPTHHIATASLRQRGHAHPLQHQHSPEQQPGPQQQAAAGGDGTQGTGAHVPPLVLVQNADARSQDSVSNSSIENEGAGVAPVGVAEQRVSNLLQSLLVAACLGVIYAVRQIPTSVIWGYFAFMALDSMPGSQFCERLLLLITDPHERPHRAYMEGVPFKVVAVFTFFQFAYLAGVYVLTTRAGIGGVAFPLVIVLLIPIRNYVLPRIFKPEHLHALDPNTVT